jgi:hypothetical protein
MAAVKETCGKDDGMWDFDDELLLMMGGVVQCRRSRQRWLALRIEELEAKVHTPATLRELERHRVEFGMTNEGGKNQRSAGTLYTTDTVGMVLQWQKRAAFVTDAGILGARKQRTLKRKRVINLTQSKHKMQRTLFLNIVVAQCTTIL